MHSNKMQNDQRDEVKQHYSDLVNADAGVVDGIKGLDRNLKPAAVHAVKPVVGKDKNAEPKNQGHVMDV